MIVKKIFPKDFMSFMPYDLADSTDLYYTGLANKVMGILEKRLGGSGIIDDREDMQLASIYFTLWFEDICSGIGIWKTVTGEFRKRYGTSLPFYDMTEYYQGEVNVQDLALLLWHLLIVSGDAGRVYNPENTELVSLAAELAGLFDGEYETAPENSRLYDYVHNPEVSADWWTCRDLMEWFLMSSYAFVGADMELDDRVESSQYMDIDISPDKVSYLSVTDMMFNYRKNLLSFTVPQWLEKITGNRVFGDICRNEQSIYRFKGLAGDVFMLEDMTDGREYRVMRDSVGERSLAALYPGKTVLYTNLVSFQGKYYISGLMSSFKDDIGLDADVKRIREERDLKNSQSDNYPVFMEASGGAPAVVVKDVEAVNNFLTGKMHLHYSGSLPVISKSSCYAIYCDPVTGLCFSPDGGECIALESNRFYDKEKAKASAVGFYLNSGNVTYRIACRLHDLDLLPDAAINSLKGYEYGRDFVHKNAGFLLDYSYSCTRKDDFNPYF